MLYSEVFDQRARQFANAAKTATAVSAPGLLGFSRFYATLAEQQLLAEREENMAECASVDEAQHDVWLNEGGRDG